VQFHPGKGESYYSWSWFYKLQLAGKLDEILKIRNTGN